MVFVVSTVPVGTGSPAFSHVLRQYVETVRGKRTKVKS
jgi:hypothetical protein